MAQALDLRSAEGLPIGRVFAPAAGGKPAPAVIILHEIFGLTDFIRSRVPFFAARGYAALAVDMYFRVRPGAVFPYEGQGFTDAFNTRNMLNDDQSVDDIGTMVEQLRRRPECNGDVFLVGYCLGGLQVYLAAARLPVQAGVSFHGVRLEKRLEVADKVKMPLQLHFCGLDKHVSQAAVAQVKTALAHKPDIEIFDYPTVDHGFTREGLKVYNAAEAHTAHARMFGFLERCRTGVPA